MCLNTECSVILINREFIRKQLSNLQIRKLASLMLIREVRNKIIKTDEYYVFKIYINEHVNDLTSTTILIIEAYLVNDLKANMLIKTNIITSQSLCINLSK